MTTILQSGPRAIAVERIEQGPDLPWVVFSNSLLTDRSLWEAQVAALGRDFNVMLYDQYGHGASPVGPQASLTFDELADDLLAVIAATGAQYVTVVGVSMGVPTALTAFARAPARFSKLVLVNGQTVTPPEAAEMWDSRISQAQTDFAGFCAATMGRWLAPEVAEGPLGQRLHQMMTATPFAGFAACARALRRFDTRDALALLDDPARRIPVLAVAGLNDNALAAHMADVFPRRATYVGIADAGHLPCYERPDDFNDHLLRFLRG